MMVWLTTLERNIQSNEHTARLYIYTRVVSSSGTALV